MAILYDYYCSAGCGDFEALRSMQERTWAECPECGSVASLVIRKVSPAVLFRPFLYEHLTQGDVLVESPRQLRELCEKNDQRAPVLENSAVWRSEKPREV